MIWLIVLHNHEFLRRELELSSSTGMDNAKGAEMVFISGEWSIYKQLCVVTQSKKECQNLAGVGG